MTNTNETTWKICGKQHKGLCWKLNSSKNAGSNNHYSGNSAFNKKQLQVINKMFKFHSSTKKEESDSESEALADGWKKGINLVQQMYIDQQYRTDNGMDLDEEVKLLTTTN